MHIGRRIREVFDGKPRSCSVTWFAGQLHCDRRNVYHIFARSTIDTELLHRISIILDHNFFSDLAEELARGKGECEVFCHTL